MRALRRSLWALLDRVASEQPCRSPPSSSARRPTRSCAWTRRRGERRGARRRGARLRHGRPARADRPAASGRRSSTGCRERMGYPQAPGLPELREAIAGWAGAAVRRRRSTRTPRSIPTLGSKEAIFSFAQVVVDLERRQGHGRLHRARLPGLRARRPLRRRAAARAAAARGERLPPRPRRDRRGDVERAWPSSGSTTRTTRPCAVAPLAFYERLAELGARARLRPRLGRGLHRALVRGAAALGARSSPTAPTSRSSTRSPSARR